MQGIFWGLYQGCKAGAGAGASDFKYAGAEPEQEPVISKMLMHSWS